MHNLPAGHQSPDSKHPQRGNLGHNAPSNGNPNLSESAVGGKKRLWGLHFFDKGVKCKVFKIIGWVLSWFVFLLPLWMTCCSKSKNKELASDEEPGSSNGQNPRKITANHPANLEADKVDAFSPVVRRPIGDASTSAWSVDARETGHGGLYNGESSSSDEGAMDNPFSQQRTGLSPKGDGNRRHALSPGIGLRPPALGADDVSWSSDEDVEFPGGDHRSTGAAQLISNIITAIDEVEELNDEHQAEEKAGVAQTTHQEHVRKVSAENPRMSIEQLHQHLNAKKN